uniref:Uncharacterized protein n=1 Tax=Arundo donax TaxID=35708 RepID=A0A0A9FMJ9_ARUDO
MTTVNRMSLDSDNSVDRLGTFCNGNLILLVMILVNTSMDERLGFCYVPTMEIVMHYLWKTFLAQDMIIL